MSLDEFFAAQRWIPFINQGSDAPPFAAMEAIGCYADGTLKLQQPSLSSALDSIFFNGPEAVPSGKPGRCTRDWPVVAYAPGVTLGQCGTVSSTWGLDDGEVGFYAWGELRTDYILVVRCPGIYYEGGNFAL